MSDLLRSITVLIVDDQSLVRDGITRIVNSQPDMKTVGTAADGRQALARVLEHQPDVVLMDIRMPVLDGIKATQAIVSEGASPSTRILGLTSYDADAYAIRILKAGAIGFILKDSTAAQLVDAIRSAHNGTFTAAVGTTRRLLARLTDHPGATPPNPSALRGLTGREAVVFEHVVSGGSNPEIARELGIAEVTVKTHVGHILAKLGLRDRVQLVIWAYRQGLADRHTHGEANGGASEE